MVNAVIEKNLRMFRERIVLHTAPTGAWEYRIAEYREKQDYCMLTDWLPLDAAGWVGDYFKKD